MIARAFAVAARRPLQVSASRIVASQLNFNVARTLIVPSYPRFMPVKTIDVSLVAVQYHVALLGSLKKIFRPYALERSVNYQSHLNTSLFIFL
jgi:hypothetical protein